MIMTLDLLPRVEYMYNVSQLIPHGNMNAKGLGVKIVSKAIHASQTIRVLQGEVVFIGILGGFVGKYTKHHMDIRKIKSDIIWAEMETPHDLIIIDEESNKHTKIKKDLSLVHEKNIIKLDQKIRSYVKRTTTLVLEGTAPNGVCPSIYPRLIVEGKKYGTKTVISTGDKGVFFSALEKMPYGIMFTIEQLEELGMTTTNIEDIVRQLAPYLNKGVHYIGVDLQKQGGLLLSKNKACYMEPMVEEVLPWENEASAAFLGAFAIGIDRKYEQEKTAKLAMATALAAQRSKEDNLYKKNDIDGLLKKVKIRELSKNLLKVR